MLINKKDIPGMGWLEGLLQPKTQVLRFTDKESAMAVKRFLKKSKQMRFVELSVRKTKIVNNYKWYGDNYQLSYKFFACELFFVVELKAVLRKLGLVVRDAAANIFIIEKKDDHENK